MKDVSLELVHVPAEPAHRSLHKTRLEILGPHREHEVHARVLYLHAQRLDESALEFRAEEHGSERERTDKAHSHKPSAAVEKVSLTSTWRAAK